MYMIDHHACMRLAVLTILRGTPGSIFHFGVVCSSWVGICRGTTRRTYLAPLGDITLDCVRAANCMMSRSASFAADCTLPTVVMIQHFCPVRVVLLLWLVQARGCFWTLEQPATSLAWRHHRFRQLCRRLRVWRIGFWLGMFGAKSPKRLRLWANSKAIRAFKTQPMTKKDRDRLPQRLAKKKINSRGEVTYTGDKAALKESQTGTYMQCMYSECTAYC